MNKRLEVLSRAYEGSKGALQAERLEFAHEMSLAGFSMRQIESVTGLHIRHVAKVVDRSVPTIGGRLNEESIPLIKYASGVEDRAELIELAGRIHEDGTSMLMISDLLGISQGLVQSLVRAYRRGKAEGGEDE